MKASVDKVQCVGCGLCVDVCPQQAITMNDVAVVDPGKCNECGACMDACPNNAITWADPKKVAAS